MAQVNAGRVRFIGRGEYDNSTQYYTFDLVDYNGNSYFAKSNTMGNLPTNSTYWQLVAEKGNTGNTGPTGPTGKGIASIAKTASAGLIDTYTITFTDGTTSTFNITNGQDGEVTQEVFDEEIDRLKMVYNALPSQEANGENITIDGTAEVPLRKINLKGNTSQNGEPTPDTPQDIHVVSGDNTIKVEGKNLCKIEAHTYQDLSRAPSVGQPLPLFNTNGTIKIKIDLSTFDKSEAYTVSARNDITNLRCFYCDSNDLYISSERTSNPRTLSIPTNASVLYIFIKISNVTDLTPIPLEDYEFQIEKGSSATTYEPYQSQTYPINLGDIELCKMGDYQDYIYKENDNWYKHEVIKKGNTSSFGLVQKVTSTMGDNLYGYAINVPSIKRDYSDLGSVISNIFVPKILGSTESTTDPNNVRFNQGISKHSHHSNSQIVISINKSYLTTGNVNEVIPFLDSKDFIFYFLLQTPTEVQITDSTLISQLEAIKEAESYSGQTNISQTNNDMPFTITAEAILSLKNILNI